MVVVLIAAAIAGGAYGGATWAGRKKQTAARKRKRKRRRQAAALVKAEADRKGARQIYFQSRDRSEETGFRVGQTLAQAKASLEAASAVVEKLQNMDPFDRQLGALVDRVKRAESVLRSISDPTVEADAVQSAATYRKLTVGEQGPATAYRKALRELGVVPRMANFTALQARARLKKEQSGSPGLGGFAGQDVSDAAINVAIAASPAGAVIEAYGAYSRRKDKKKAKRRRKQQKQKQMRMLAIEAKRVSSFKKFWAAWEAMLGVREEVGFLVSDVEVKLSRVKRKASTAAWPVSFDDSVVAAFAELREIEAFLSGEPPITFMDPGSHKEELDEAYAVVAETNLVYEGARQSLRNVLRKADELNTQATELAAMDRIRRYQPRGRRRGGRRGGGTGALGDLTGAGSGTGLGLILLGSALFAMSLR